MENTAKTWSKMLNKHINLINKWKIPLKMWKLLSNIENTAKIYEKLVDELRFAYWHCSSTRPVKPHLSGAPRRGQRSVRKGKGRGSPGQLVSCIIYYFRAHYFAPNISRSTGINRGQHSTMSKWRQLLLHLLRCHEEVLIWGAHLRTPFATSFTYTIHVTILLKWFVIPFKF